MRVKICGITKPEQGKAIANLGATALGFICVPSSPRFVSIAQIKTIVRILPPEVDRIGVFVNAQPKDIGRAVATAGLTGVQLHGEESPEFCQKLREQLPKVEIIKALRVQTAESLSRANAYGNCVHTLLLDAYHPHLLGGTGQTLHWQSLKAFRPSLPWFLAGGLTPENILAALREVDPSGIDLSSGVERAPGDKDLDKVTRLFQILTRDSPMANNQKPTLRLPFDDPLGKRSVQATNNQ